MKALHLLGANADLIGERADFDNLTTPQYQFNVPNMRPIVILPEITIGLF